LNHQGDAVLPELLVRVFFFFFFLFYLSDSFCFHISPILVMVFVDFFHRFSIYFVFLGIEMVINIGFFLLDDMKIGLLC
jgi:hypothetical protein